MRTTEIAVGLLSPKTQSYQPGSGGRPTYTLEDVCFALAMLERPKMVEFTGERQKKIPGLIIRIKFADELNHLRDLDYEVWLQIVVEMAIKQKWHYPKDAGQEFWRKMGRMAIAEEISPHVCIRCGGIRDKDTDQTIEIKEGKRSTCSLCRGTGHREPTDGARADTIGISRKVWNETWAPRYEEIRQRMAYLCNLAERVIKRNFSVDAG